MKRIAIMLLLLAPLTSSAFDAYRIEAHKRKAGEHEDEQVDRPWLSIKDTREYIYLEIEVRRMSPNVPADVTVAWGIMLESAGERMLLGESGERQVNIPYGQTATVDTGIATLKGLEFDHRFNTGSAEDDVAGYGIRIKDAAGQVLAEKYTPPSIQKELEKAIARKEQEKAKQKTIDRPRKPMKSPLKRRRPPLPAWRGSQK